MQLERNKELVREGVAAAGTRMVALCFGLGLDKRLGVFRYLSQAVGPEGAGRTIAAEFPGGVSSFGVVGRRFARHAQTFEQAEKLMQVTTTPADEIGRAHV